MFADILPCLSGPVVALLVWMLRCLLWFIAFPALGDLWETPPRYQSLWRKNGGDLNLWPKEETERIRASGQRPR